MNFRKRTNRSRSPLKARPLRVPGQSLDEEIADLTSTKLVELVFVPVYFTAMAGMEWWRWFRSAPPSPVLLTVTAALAWCWFAYRFPKLRVLLHNLRQGRDGERAVAELLGELRIAGYRVLHDVVGEGFNVDHVLVGPAGVFSIDTKTISKNPGRAAQVTYDGRSVLVNGRKPDRDPIAQAEAQARWLPAGVKVVVASGRIMRRRAERVAPCLPRD